MESYRTEEEQVEALKKWWQENSRSTLLAIAVALGGGFGWQAWQEQKAEQAEVASASYEEMLQAVSVGAQATDEQKATAHHLATTLKADYPNSTYGQFAALHLAKMAVEASDLDTAAEELRWVLAQSPAPEIERVAQLRLARVLADQGEVDAALKMVSIADTGAFSASYAEAEGDFHMMQGNESMAREAYQRAVDLQSGGQGESGVVSLKLQSLVPVPPRESTEVVDAGESGEVEAEAADTVPDAEADTTEGEG